MRRRALLARREGGPSSGPCARRRPCAPAAASCRRRGRPRRRRRGRPSRAARRAPAAPARPRRPRAPRDAGRCRPRPTSRRATRRAPAAGGRPPFRRARRRRARRARRRPRAASAAGGRGGRCSRRGRPSKARSESRQTPEPPRTKKISSSPVWRWKGVDHLPGSTWIRLTPTVFVPAAEPRSVQSACEVARLRAAALDLVPVGDHAPIMSRASAVRGARPPPPQLSTPEPAPVPLALPRRAVRVAPRAVLRAAHSSGRVRRSGRAGRGRGIRPYRRR